MKIAVLPHSTGFWPHANQVGPPSNLRGNAYRLIVRVSYRGQALYVKALLSHAEYDHWAAILEHIEFDDTAKTQQRELPDVLMGALDTHDRTRHPEQFASDPLGMLKYAMEQTSMTQADLARLLGVSTAHANQICHGKRGISLPVAQQLAQRFKLNVSAFLK